MWVIGHRGAPRLAVENSLQSLQIAIDEGADGVELDIQRCADGELVVWHDDSLLRLTGLDRSLASTPWRQLRPLSARTAELQAQPIAHLDQVLAWCDGRPWRVNFELKLPAGATDRDAIGLATAFGRRVQAAWQPQWVVSSFSQAVLSSLASQWPDAQRGGLFEREVPAPAQQAAEGQVALPSPWQQVHPEQRLATAGQLQAWHTAGWPVWLWTVNAPPEVEAAAQLAAAGLVQAVITDDPAGVRRRSG